MPSFDPSFALSFSFSFSDFDLDELGMRFLASSCCQTCVAFSSSSMVYIWRDKLDANKVLTVLTTPISVNNSEVLLA